MSNKLKHRQLEQMTKKEPVVTCHRITGSGQWIRWILVMCCLILAYGFCLITSEHEQPFMWISLILALLIGVRMLFEIHLNRLLSIIVSVLVPMCSFWIFEGYSHVVFASEKGITWKIQVLNILLYMLIYVLCLAITGSLGAAAIVSTMAEMIIALMNYYTVSFRNTPILPWDLLSIKTALSVTTQYTFKLPGRILMTSLLFVLLAALGSMAGVTLKGWKRRLSVGGGAIAAILGFVLLVQTSWVADAFKLDDILFTPKVLYRNNGFMVAFTVNLQYLKVDKPDNYRSNQLNQIADELVQEAESAAAEQTAPNVIVIMNESFSDPAVLADFTTNEDYMPFVHAMQQGQVEDVVSGNLYVSVCGGNTANSEFEFLTGNTTAFLPPGSIAYQQYIHDEMPSMARRLKTIADYQTLAMHPYYTTGWDRHEVYPFFGFDDMLFIEQMKKMPYFSAGNGYLRKYISDQSVTDLLIHQMENEKIPGQPYFAFTVTMQNHGGYFESFDNFEQEIEVTSVDKDSRYKAYLDMYLSLMKRSDEALENLVMYLKTVEEPTVLVFFGDHQPGDYVLKSVYKTQDGQSLEEAQKRYVVPFIVWANYDIEDEQVDAISLNYLQTLVCEKAGIPLSGYQIFLSKLRQKLPVITANVMIDSEGHYYQNGDQTPYEDELEIYKAFQYNYLFDKKERRSALFGESAS